MCRKRFNIPSGSYLSSGVGKSVLKPHIHTLIEWGRRTVPVRKVSRRCMLHQPANHITRDVRLAKNIHYLADIILEFFLKLVLKVAISVCASLGVSVVSPVELDDLCLDLA